MDPLAGTDRIRGNKLDIGDVTDSDYQFELIEEYLNNNFIVDEESLLKYKT